MNVELALETAEYLMEAAGRKQEMKEKRRSRGIGREALAGITWEGRIEADRQPYVILRMVRIIREPLRHSQRVCAKLKKVRQCRRKRRGQKS